MNEPPTPQIRAFVAIDLPPAIKASLATTTQELQAKLTGPEYAWVLPNSIHLTLKFLGHVDADRIPAIAEALAGATKNVTPFNLRLEGAGTFPSGRRPNVIWAGLNGDLNALFALRALVESALADIRLSRERLSFRPHLTLARLRKRLSDGGVQALHQALTLVPHNAVEPFTVDEVRLIRSELQPEGARYSALGTAKLTG